MESQVPLHPVIVHTPIALIIVSALFELIGRAVDLAWWRNAALALLVIGVLGAGLAVLSGKQAEEQVEKVGGVPHSAIEAHEQMAQTTLWLGIAAVLLRLLSGRAGRARALMSGFALALQLVIAVTVGITAYRGGRLVYEYGAGVRVNGQPVTSGPSEGRSHPHP